MENNLTDMNFRTDKIYYIHYGNDNWGAYRYVGKFKLGDQIFLQCVSLEEGFDSQKNTFIPTHYIQKIIEFESYSEYETRYDHWLEEEKEKKYKDPF